MNDRKNARLSHQVNEKFIELVEMEHVLTSVKPTPVPASVTAIILKAMNASEDPCKNAKTVPFPLPDTVRFTRRLWFRADVVCFASAVCFLVVNCISLSYVNARNDAQLYGIYDVDSQPVHHWDFASIQIVSSSPIALKELNLNAPFWPTPEETLRIKELQSPNPKLLYLDPLFPRPQRVHPVGTKSFVT